MMRDKDLLILGYSFSDAHNNSIIKNLTDDHTNYTVVDYSPKTNKETNRESTNERRIDFVNLVEESCIQKPELFEKPYSPNHEFDENNCWEYRMDNCKAILDFNGTEIALEEYAI
ncbi:MAG TPA: hypothetical protein PKD16_18135 [Saprospiraceae bacterium]|jgi:hypothetical protein|nr:hypothetical protein [Saprospiraceae bacterium]